MQASMARAAQTYYRTQVTSQSPVELVVMLYDGAIRFLGVASDAMRRRDLVAKGEAMSRSLAILGELQNTLDLEAGGDVAQKLDALYTYINGRLLDANMHNVPEHVDESIRLLSTLRSAWVEIAAPGRAATPSLQARG